MKIVLFYRLFIPVIKFRSLKKFALFHMLISSIVLGAMTGCSIQKKEVQLKRDDGLISFNLLQINDIYEIAPLSNGQIGGVARVATIDHELKAKNPNTLTVLAGDFLSPSLMSELSIDGQKIAGRQMIEALNSAGIDLVTFGNHEFDLKEEQLQGRIDESQFIWMTSNILHRSPEGELNRFHKDKNGHRSYFPDSYIWHIRDADGTRLKVGFFGVTLSSFTKSYVYYEDVFLEAKKAYQHLADQCDIVLGITHLPISQDRELAVLLPDISLIMGGHDHNHMLHRVGAVQIAKADANARSAYIHHFTYDHNTKKYDLTSELKVLDEEVARDEMTTRIVEKWEGMMLERIGEVIQDPKRIIFETTAPLDGLESSVRYHPTNLGVIITSAMAAAAKKPVVGAIFNSGGIRLDDVLTGSISAIDIFRTLPYGGAIYEVEMTGRLLIDVLRYAEAHKGDGAYLQRFNLEKDANSGKWLAKGLPILPDQNYRIVLNDYLMTGFDIPFLVEDHPGILSIDRPDKEVLTDQRNDIRVVVVNYLNNGRK